MNHPRELPDAFHAEVSRAVRADMDAFGDWLGGACMGHGDVDSDRICRMPSLIAQRLREATTPQVLHLLMTDADPMVVIQCRDDLQRRFMADQGRALDSTKAALLAERWQA